MRIHCFQHVPYESPATILQWIQENEHVLRYTHFFESDIRLPSLGDFDALLIMGGSMNVDEEDRYPWLKQEKQFIREAVRAGKKVLGICLGSQLLAQACGGIVYHAPEREIGFYPVTFTPAALKHPVFNHFMQHYPVFHWHGDTFHLPPGAILLASTDTCPNQAYMIGEDVLGLQFHLEMNVASIETMIFHNKTDLAGGGAHVQTEEEIRSRYRNLEQNKRDLFLLLGQFFNG